jgi:curved DNA-binding protein CbpA
MKTTTSPGDPYGVLGLKRGASHEEIRRAYFRKVREHPPETEPEAFKAIRAAYEQLRSTEQRAVTDLFLLQPPPPWEPPVHRQPLQFDLRLHPEEILAAARALTDLARDDFRDDYKPVHLPR